MTATTVIDALGNDVGGGDFGVPADPALWPAALALLLALAVVLVLVRVRKGVTA